MVDSKIQIISQYKKAFPRISQKMWAEWYFVTVKQLLKQKKLKPNARKILQKNMPLTVVFVDSKKGRELNRQYRKKATATDVLSFSPSEDGQLGELVFCIPVVQKKAIAHQISFRDEILYLFIHGMLHLLTYDHESDDKEAQEMYRIQDSVYEYFLNRH